MELSEKNLIVKNSIPSRSLLNFETAKIDIHPDILTRDYIKIVVYLYSVFVHVFIFSIFESLFFWFYITKEEDAAILNQINDVVLLGNLFCTNVNDDFDFTALYDYQEDKRDDYNEKLPFNNTIMLNGYLFCTIILLNIILKFTKINIIKLNFKIVREQSATFILLFIYEYLFFRNIIYNYVPNSSNKIVKKIFEKCV